MPEDEFSDEEFELEEEPSEEGSEEGQEDLSEEEFGQEEELLEEGEEGEAISEEEEVSEELEAPEEEIEEEPSEYESEGLLDDVNFPVIISVGSTTKSVKDILKFREGQIIELHKVPTDPVEVLANGKPIARGELVEVDGKLGVKITRLLK